MKKIFKMAMMLFVLGSFLALPAIGLAEEYTAVGEMKKEEKKKKEEAKKEEKKAVELEEIVVTATRTEKEVSEIPASVNVVTKKDMEKRNIQTVSQALNNLPGVLSGQIMSHSPSITLRGIPGTNRTLIQLDGTTLNDAWQGYQRNLSGLSPEDIERIEVVRGPFSSLYGGYAMGGVVNIITKMPEKRKVILKAGYGSSWERGDAMDDLKKFYLSYGDKFKDKLSIFLSYGHNSTNGFSISPNIQKTQPPAGITGWSYTTDTKGNTHYLIGDKGDKIWWDESITIKAEYDFSKKSKINLSFMRTSFKGEYAEPHTYLRDTSGNEVMSYGSVKESSFLSYDIGRIENDYIMRYETAFGDMKTKISLGLVEEEKGNWYATIPGPTATHLGGAGGVSDYPSKAYIADIQFTLPLLERHFLTFGGSFRRGEACYERHNATNWQDKESKTDLTYQSEGKDRTYAFFVQDEIMILNNLTAYLGFRQDWWESYDGYVNQVGTAGYPISYDKKDASSFSPKAAIVYKPFEKTILRASAGKAFRPPTIAELYGTWTSMWTGIGITTEGGPGLKPETTVSWDIGAEQELWKGAEVKATYFENNLKDLIYKKTVSPTYKKRMNVGKAKNKGVELEAEQRFDMGLRLFANFTYTDAKVTENEAMPEIVGKKLTGVPEEMFNAGGDFKKGPFSASLIGRYVSKVYRDEGNKDTVNNVYTSRDSYFVTDAKVSYRLAKFASVSLSVDNIFDRDYFAFDKAPGRSWFGELTMSF